MKRDDIKAILGEGATEEQITNLLNTFHNAGKEKDNEIARLNGEISKFSDYNDIKSKLTAIEQANMTEQQKMEADKKATAEYLKKAQVIYNTAKVKEILAGEAIDEALLSRLVSEDEASSIASANALKQTLSNLKDNVTKQTKDSLMTVDLKPGITNVNQNQEVMTFEKFSNLSASEQEKFMTEHPEEFEKL